MKPKEVSQAQTTSDKGLGTKLTFDADARSWTVAFEGFNGIITTTFGCFGVVIGETTTTPVRFLCINFATAAELGVRVVNLATAI